MAVRQTIQIGDDRLKAENQKISKKNLAKIREVVKDLTDTMRENQLIGIAAPQIGENYQLFVTEPRVTKFRTLDQADELRVYLNPKITWTSTETIELYEGCGSVLNGKLFAPVVRPRAIKINYTDLEGNKWWLKCDGILSRVIQHEYDHLQGIEFLEKVAEPKRYLTYEWYLKKIKDNPLYIERARITLKESGQE